VTFKFLLFLLGLVVSFLSFRKPKSARTLPKPEEPKAEDQAEK